ncbi:unnamed protein product, partial [Peniophora sp. CBMAI 1063]
VLHQRPVTSTRWACDCVAGILISRTVLLGR